MKKYTSGEFVATKYGIYKAAQDIITSFPSTIIANGSSASAVIKGNMQQAGTPTPAAPIYPTECGDLSIGNYVIPVVSGGVTTSINLSAVQATRQIKKLVLTGEESFIYQSQYNRFYIEVAGAYYSGTTRTTPCICSHYQSIHDGRVIDDVPNQSIYITISNTITSFNIKTSDYTSETDFKAYLAQQYANETPVIIWYILTSPTTSILNEPIRKISTYADSVAASAIPTTAGSQTFNIDTTLKPSEVDLTYTGWHMYDDHKYSGGEWG